MTPCHSASSTVSPHTRMATTAWRGVMRVTRHSTALPTCGRTSRCRRPPPAAPRDTEMVGSSPPPVAWLGCCCWSAALSLFWRLGGPLIAVGVEVEEEEEDVPGWEMDTAPRREL